MIKPALQGTAVDRDAPRRVLVVSVILGIALPILGTVWAGHAFPEWAWLSLPFHSTLEVAGAALGLVLAVMILQSRKTKCTTRRMWIACALISMATMDIFHSCVPVGVSFVWLHSVAVMVGGVFFSLVWFPEREISRATAWSASAAVLLVATLVGGYSAGYPEGLPAMVEQGQFTPMADALNFIGGGLTILAALNFALAHYRNGKQEELLFLLLCLLFGFSGILFQMSGIWQSGWWFWHVLRFGGYILAFWLAMLSYRSSEEETLRAHAELDTLFNTSVDGKRLVGPGFEMLRCNDTFSEMAGVNGGSAQRMKCHEVFPGPQCETKNCPVRQLAHGSVSELEREVTKTRQDGKELTCILRAARLTGPDGSFRGVIESFLDITDRKEAEQKLQQQGEQKAAQAELSDLMRGEQEIDELCRKVITFLCKHVSAQTGLMYLKDDNGELRLVASYAHKRRKHLAAAYKPGEGLVGQAALEKADIILDKVPPDYISVESGLGESAPKHIYVKPIIHDGNVGAVIELGTLGRFDEAQSAFLDMVTENIAVSLEAGRSRTRLAQSLEESQQLSMELQAQQEELRTTNEELEEHTQRLKESEERLKAQQEELQVTNEELEEKNELTQQQKDEVERARNEIEEKAEELALASKYKSEFLANMSHELRTPLNSLLLLAQGLSENKEGNLTEDQLEAIRIVHGSGGDLLNLINEILDLSKIEAGRMELRLEDIDLKQFAERIRSSMQHMAAEKGLDFQVEVTNDAPARITSDRKRAKQVLRNLIANAIKFTEKGSVYISFRRPPPDVSLTRSGLSADTSLLVEVRDTGIGIPPVKQKVIFEAFQQADGGTARRYGGTGLGLSISRELARLLGGEIHLRSVVGEGSAFTLYLPLKTEKRRSEPNNVTEADRSASDAESSHAADSSASHAPVSIPDDRESLSAGDRTILVIEDDPRFARLLHAKCHEKGFKCLAAPTGEAGLELATKHLPVAVLLDIRLPGMNGWAVLNALKDDIRTRHIPVHVVSAEEATTEALRKGAVGHTTKPLNQQDIEEAFRRLESVSTEGPRSVLVVEDNDEMRLNTVELIGGRDVKVDQARNGTEALEALRGGRYDCVVMDLGLPDMDGNAMLAQLEREGVRMPPVIVHTARDLSHEQETRLREHADSIVIKDVRSQERLLDEVSLFLHRVVSQMPETQRQIIRDLHDTEALLRNKKVLVVDDDMRTTFAVSRLLTERGMKTLKAENGEKALRLLEEDNDIDLVLMDIMMPVMDGHEAIRRVRAFEGRARNVPIIALTAKAMPEDRRKCVEAGANDYMAKPVDPQRLVSMLRVWLYR